MKTFARCVLVGLLLGLVAPGPAWSRPQGRVVKTGRHSPKASAATPPQAHRRLRVEDTPVCSPAQTQTWEFARDHTMGVVGLDPLGHKIGSHAAARFYPNPFAGRNWYPVDGFKHTFCGRVSRFEFYDEPFSLENDWNIYVIPSAPFEYVIRDVLAAFPRAARETPHCEGGTNNCAIAEAQPPRPFFDNAWFRRGDDTTPLAGREMCAYGPWVREEAHNNHPEIHPSELLWWTSPGPRAEWWLLLLQDSSERFHRPQRYALSGQSEPGWRPWAQSPRTGQFRLAFEFTVGGAPAQYAVAGVEGASRHVVTAEDPEAARDDDDGASHALVYDGRVAVRVTERPAEDDAVGVRFVDLCRDAGGKRLRGYVALTSKVGLDQKGGEGYHLLRVTGGGTPAPSGAQTTGGGLATRGTQRGGGAPPPGEAAPVAGSLRRVVIDGRPTLVGSVELRGAAGVAAAARPSGVEVLTEGGRRGVNTRRGGGVTRGGWRAATVVEGVPVLSGGSLNLRGGQDGQRIPLPTITLAPEATTRGGAERPAEAAALATMVRAAGGEVRGPTPGARAVAVESWEVEATPAYAPAHDGRVVREDSSAFSAELNAVVRGTDAARRDLFGSERPFAVEWSFAAVDLATGAVVPVRVGAQAAAGEIRVETPGPDAATASRLRVRFPEAPAGHVYELVATAKVTDTYGGTATVEQRVWSHFVDVTTAGRGEEQILSAVAALAGLRDVPLLSSPAAPTATDAAARRARMFRTLTAQTADDGRLSPDELRSLILTRDLLRGR